VFLKIFYVGGFTMLDVTEIAQQQIAEFFKDKEVRPIRLFLNQSG
jgi:Fe-S cluster assembly iron-binding protein IscA